MVQPNGDFHQPNRLLDKNGFSKKYERVIKHIKEGMSPEGAVRLVFGIVRSTWFEWKNHAEDDIKAGFTADESNLIKLYEGIAAADMRTRRRLEIKSVEMATDEEPSIDMLKFLLERRYGYKKKSQQDVEVSTKDDFNFNVNIVESKPIDKD